MYPIEVKAVRRQHPAVLEAAFMGIADATWGERVVAFLQRRAGETVDAASLTAFAAQNICKLNCPKVVHLRDYFPRTALGKIQRTVLCVNATELRSAVHS